MSSVEDIRIFRSQITLRQRPKEVTRMLSLFPVILRFLRGTTLGICLKVIVNEKPLNLEKTTSSSDFVINLCYKDHSKVKFYQIFKKKINEKSKNTKED